MRPGSRREREMRSQERDLRAIQAREKMIASRLDTGATSAGAARYTLAIPEIVTDLTIVDLGSGASPLVSNLIANGANAFGVDRLYEDDKTLEESAVNSVTKIAQRFLKMNRPDIAKTTENSLRIFFDSFRANRKHYLAGWFTQTNLPSDFSDITVSLHALSDMGADYSLMLAALREALRITKPGGKVVMAPFHIQDSPRYNLYSAVHLSAIHKLRSEGITPHVVKNPKTLEIPRVELLKP